MLPITLVLLLLDYYAVTFLTEPVTVLSCVMAVVPFARSSTTTSVDPTQRSEKPAAEPFPSLYLRQDAISMKKPLIYFLSYT